MLCNIANNNHTFKCLLIHSAHYCACNLLSPFIEQAVVPSTFAAMTKMEIVEDSNAHVHLLVTPLIGNK